MSKIIKSIIYKITSKTTGKVFVGQTRNYLERVKDCRGYFSTYGIDGRFKGHLFRAKKGASSPLHVDIRKYGDEDFSIEELEMCELSQADSRECFYIQDLNSMIPNGYNVQKGGEGFKTMSVKISEYKKMNIQKIIQRPIKKNGVYDSVRVMLQIEGHENKVRVMFNSGKHKTFELCVKNANRFINKIKGDDTEIISYIDKPKYQDKLDLFSGMNISKLRVTPFKYKTFYTVAVYVRTDIMTKQSEEKRINFGSKNISLSDALDISLEFCYALSTKDKVFVSDNFDSLLTIEV
ncbi:MAG: hypothetical protein PHG66_00475 [Candidatus Colwellbacteria bacterium]|nr:hypothetical protein [Candidatus Colwellbacteria bacterium]